MAPRTLVVHGALAATQVLFGAGTVVGDFGMHGTNPVLFGFLREGLAGPILAGAAYAVTRQAWPRLEDVPLVLVTGFAFYVGQFFFVLGLKLTDPVSTSAWQPSQPLFTAALAALVGFERASPRAFLGIFIAVVGAIFMAVWGTKETESTAGWARAAGQGLLCLNCLGTSCFVLLSKKLLRRYQSVSVTGWSYLVAGFLMLVTLLTVNETPPLLRFVCENKDAEVTQQCIDGAWTVTESMVLPLAYRLFLNSVIAYSLIIWASRYAKASVVSAYTVLQPLSCSAVSAALILSMGAAFGRKYDLREPGVQDLGGLGIAFGLAILFGRKDGTLERAEGDDLPPQSSAIQIVVSGANLLHGDELEQ